MISKTMHPYSAAPVVLLTLAILVAAPAIGAGPLYWDWPQGRSFAEMQLDGAALDGDGRLVAGLPAEAVGPQGSEVYWVLETDGDGGFFTGAGHDGTIYHTDSAGRTGVFARLGASEVTSLLFVPGRGLFAGTAPEGKLFHLDSAGQVKLLGTVEGGYVWALTAGGERDEIWLAAGSPASLYRHEQENGLSRILEFPAANALDVMTEADGRLAVATQGPGLVYRIDPRHPDRAELLFEAPQDEVRQLLAGPDGRLYALALNPVDDVQMAGPVNGTGGMNGNGAPPTSLMMLLAGNGEPTVPRAALWRIGTDGRVEPEWSGDEDLLTAAWSGQYGWLAGGPLNQGLGAAQLLRLTPPAGSHPIAGWSGGDVLDILLPDASADAGRILVAQGHPHSVVALGDEVDGERAALSPPLDAKRPVHWGRLRWEGSGRTKDLKWSVRGGNRSQPDESWTEWSGNWNDGDRPVDLPLCRFLQWRVEFPADEAEDAAGVTSVSVSAWAENAAPRIERFEQELLQGLESGGLVAHSENLTQTFRSGLKAEFDRQVVSREPVAARAAAASRTVRVFTWTGVDPDEDRLLYRLEYRRDGGSAWRPVADETREMLGSWDTSEVPDGTYRLRLTASDKPDNPDAQALSAQREIGPVFVDNTPPEIEGLKLQRTGAGFRIRLAAADGGCVLARTTLEMPDGSVRRLDPVDRICDSRSETFDATIAWPEPGADAGVEPWRLRVEVMDLNGNVAVAEGDVR